MSYFFAHNLVGFRSVTLRVRMLEDKGYCANVVTADLLDAGTCLTLNWDQLQAIETDTVVQHRDGLVAFN